MSWAKLCDGFYDNVKLVRVGTAATGLYSRMLSWSARNLTDGKVPSDVAIRLCPDLSPGDTLLLLEKLCEVPEDFTAGLLTRTKGGGYLIHDYLEHNPST